MRYAITNSGFLFNSPDRHNDFNIIPSNRITMKGVNFPILGVDNKGNAKIMLPGKEYKFKGSQVTEIPLRQTGGIVESLKDWWYNQDEVKDSFQMADQYDNGWYKKWLEHPETIKRAVDTSGFSEDFVKKTYINPSIEKLKTVPIYDSKKIPKQSDFNYNASKRGFKSDMNYFNDYRLPSNVAGRYSSKYNDIVMDNMNDVSTGAHEISHASGVWDFKQEQILRSMYPGRVNFEKFFEDGEPKFKDMYQERFNYLNEDGLYPRIMDIRRQLDVQPGQIIDKHKLKKLKNLSPLYELKQFYSEDEVLKILNTIASNKTDQLPRAQKGGEMKKYQKAGEYVPTLQNMPENTQRNSVLEAMLEGAGYALSTFGDIMSIPQKYITRALTDKDLPSETLGFKNIPSVNTSSMYIPYSGNPMNNYKGSYAQVPKTYDDLKNVGKHVANFGIDNILDPVNLLGASMFKSALKTSKLKPMSNVIDLRKAPAVPREFPEKGVLDKVYSEMFDYNSRTPLDSYSPEDVLLHNAENQARVADRIMTSKLIQSNDFKRPIGESVSYKDVIGDLPVDQSPVYHFRYKDIIDEPLYNQLKKENVNPWNEGGMSEALRSDIQRRLKQETDKIVQYQKYKNKTFDPRQHTADAINPRILKMNRKGGDYQEGGQTNPLYQAFITDWTNPNDIQSTQNQIQYDMDSLSNIYTSTRGMQEPFKNPFTYKGKDLLDRPKPPISVKKPTVQGIQKRPAQEANPWSGLQYSMAGLGALGLINDFTNDKPSSYERYLQQAGNTNSLYNPQNSNADYGNYTLNAGIGSNFRPRYQDGGEYDLSEEEIQRLIDEGYDIEFL